MEMFYAKLFRTINEIPDTFTLDFDQMSSALQNKLAVTRNSVARMFDRDPMLEGIKKEGKWELMVGTQNKRLS